MRVDKSKWEKVRLIDVAPICPSSENSANSVVWLLNLDMIESQTGKIIRKQYCDKKDIGTSVIQFTNRHVLWSKLRPYLNKVVLPDENGYATSELIPLQPNRIKRKYLFHLLMSKWFVAQMVASAEGARMPRASMKEFRKLTIALPSDNEQRAIAEELDGIQSMIGKCREQLEDYDRLARSIFHEMFGDPVKNDMGWEMKSLIEIVGKDCPISYGIVQAGDEVQNGIPIVRPVDLTSTFVKREGLKLVSPEISESYKRTVLKGGEILMCVRGTTGIVSIASDELKGCNVTRGIAPLRFESSNKWFMLYCIKTPQIKAIIQEYTKGATLKQINMADLRKLVFPIPPLPLQQQFATRIEAIEAMKEATKAQLADLQQLFDSRMQYYFS